MLTARMHCKFTFQPKPEDFGITEASVKYMCVRLAGDYPSLHEYEAFYRGMTSMFKTVDLKMLAVREGSVVNGEEKLEDMISKIMHNIVTFQFDSNPDYQFRPR